MPEKPNFLTEKYADLPGSQPVERAVQKNLREGESGPVNKDERIQTYLDRLEQLVLDPDREQPRKDTVGGKPRPRALSLLREMIMNKYVRPNKEKMAQGAARVEERAARELGIEAHYGEEELAQRGDIAVADLEKSLDSWILYLSDANEPYPTWFRYYAFRNILDLGDYDKDKGEFTKRSQGSTRLFPDIDRGALAYVEQMMEAAKDPAMLERLQQAQKAVARESIPPDQLITKDKALNFTKLSFSKQYAEAIKQAGEITPEMKQETRGEWVKYQKDTDPTALWASLQNKGTAWCTKGFGTAETQLKGGDFYVFYTLDKQGNPTIPRIAIRMQQDSIGEVRGVADNDQNLEGNMAAIAEKKMSELPGAEKYRKASGDMKAVTVLYDKSFKVDKETGAKTYLNSQLTRDELMFLYEINTTIEGFGYKKDPRIKELRSQRNLDQDMPIIFECEPSQIAHNPDEINQSTKAYVGELYKTIPGIQDVRPTLPDKSYLNIFQKLAGVEHVYTSFPEGKIRFHQVELGQYQNAEAYEQAIKTGDMYPDEYTKYILNHSGLAIGQSKEILELVDMSVESMGFPKGEIEQNIYQRAMELGLDKCPPEAGPALRLQYQDQPNGDWVSVGMEPISDAVGSSREFDVGRSDDGKRWLNTVWGGPERHCHPGRRFVFVRRKVSSKT